jgi:ADP-ribosylglycohydrolase
LTTLTGAITGGALALLNGVQGIPQQWIEELEHATEILNVLSVAEPLTKQK